MTRAAQINEQIERYDRKIKAVRDDLKNNNQRDKFVVVLGRIGCTYLAKGERGSISTVLTPLTAVHLNIEKAEKIAAMVSKKHDIYTQVKSAYDAKVDYESRMVNARKQWHEMLTEFVV